MSSRHHGEARVIGDLDWARTMPGSRRMAQNCAVTNCSLARRRRRWVPCHANHGSRSRGVARAPSFYIATKRLPDGECGGTGASFCLTPCQIAITVALFHSCRGTSAAVLTV
jgi:hypothetical protein